MVHETVNSEGSSPLNSWVDIESGDSPSLPSDGTQIEMTNLSIDGSAGTDISLGVDLKTITFNTDGVYIMAVEGQASAGHTTARMYLHSTFAPFPDGGGDGDGFGVYKVPPEDGAACHWMTIRRIAAGTTLVLKLAADSTTDPTVSWFGLSIFRVC
jgi:hypothetical protein